MWSCKTCYVTCSWILNWVINCTWSLMINWLSIDNYGHEDWLKINWRPIGCVWGQNLIVILFIIIIVACALDVDNLFLIHQVSYLWTYHYCNGVERMHPEMTCVCCWFINAIIAQFWNFFKEQLMENLIKSPSRSLRIIISKHLDKLVLMHPKHERISIDH